MGDLDSFFAKKDKRKVKGKNFTSTDEMAKRLEETEKKLEKELQKDTPVKKTIEEVIEEASTDVGANPVVSVVKPKKQEEEEWNDFEDKENGDLTDLKIAKLQIEDEEEGGGGGTAEDGDEDADGERGQDGVWKTKKIPSQPVKVEEPKPVVEEPKPAPTESSARSSYVPPHMRNVHEPSPLPRSGGGGAYKSKLAPDITNEMAFPSLSDAQANNPAGPWGRKNKSDDRQGFENVRHGSVRAAQDEFSSPKLSTANRFDALTDNS